MVISYPPILADVLKPIFEKIENYTTTVYQNITEVINPRNEEPPAELTEKHGEPVLSMKGSGKLPQNKNRHCLNVDIHPPPTPLIIHWSNAI